VAARHLAKEEKFWPHSDSHRRRKLLHMVEQFASVDTRAQVFWLVTALDSLSATRFKEVELFLWNRFKEQHRARDLFVRHGAQILTLRGCGK
jgi:hypothetical protein